MSIDHVESYIHIHIYTHLKKKYNCGKFCGSLWTAGKTENGPFSAVPSPSELVPVKRNMQKYQTRW